MSNLLTCRKWWECYPQGPLTWLFPVYHKCLSSKKMCFFSSYTQKHTFFLVSTPWGHSFWNCLNQTLENWVYISLPNIPNILIIVSVSPDLVLGVPGEILQRLHLWGGELSPDKTRLPWRFPRGKYFRFVRRQILQNVLEYFGLHGICEVQRLKMFFTIFILAFEDQVRILLCVCLHHFKKILHQYSIITAFIVYTFSGNMFIVFVHIVD